ncbi:DUF1868 domain-containing protein [Neorhizobium lilium]|uniref:DUF1868 domain-containing protein n=1 Tax=Neorhizobium lilium TaxID=2503024 RepID=A0A3S3TUD9_9HYPH|nr:DUF1868 domain-containing protein [Neorhizobium lilium]RWX75058.1 DUF1868 domain-containing protein [Neorhizobium lilium]
MDFSQFSPDLLAYSKTHNPNPPLHLGTRYRTRGGFLPEPGNTIVCHVAKNSQTQTALIEARERYLDMPEAGQFLFTPIASLHMTLFQGILDNRRRSAFWPQDIPLETPVEDMHEILAARLEGLPAADPFDVTVIGARPSGLLVDGRTEQDRKIMRTWRDTLARLLGFRHPDHDTYPFHITFAYVIERLDDEALPRWQAMLNEVAADLQRRQPVLELTPPAFCMFEDMNHFHELLILDANE